MSKQLRIPADDLNLLKSLQRLGVPLVIIGGHAARFHGVDREVEDLDALVDVTGRAEDVRTAISEVVGDLPPIDVAEYGMPYKLISLTNNGIWADGEITVESDAECKDCYQSRRSLGR